MNGGRSVKRRGRVGLLCLLAAATTAAAGDQPQWGQRHSRNMVSDEKGLPAMFDPATRENIKWVARLGTRCYASPVVAGGKVFIGTNNDVPRDPKHQGDRGVLLCLNERDGSLCWQLVANKLQGDQFLDWPRIGICSPPTVEGDRVYVVTNRAEVVCLDIDGQADGNDGPFKDEGQYMTPPDAAGPIKVGKTDADILWVLDMVKPPIAIRPHDGAHSSILLHGQYLYLNTGNGLNSAHTGIPRPDAPSLIVVDKATGRLVARDAERIGPRIFHASWSSPALGQVGGKPLIFFGGGDGVCYAFEALKPAPPPAAPVDLKKAWSFDCDPSAPKENVHKYIRNRTEGPSIIKGMPVHHAGRVYVAATGDIWWGKPQSVLKCIDATKTGDVTQSAEIWSYSLNRHCCSTPAIKDGLIYIADSGRTVHCIDAETGKAVWTHQTKGEIWGSALVADDKVYIGTRRGDFWILAAGRKKKVFASIQMDSPIHGAATAATGVVYVATMKYLYAIQKRGQAPSH